MIPESAPNKPARKTTIYDVARHLEVSAATVSLALNNSSQVSKETILKVREAIRELHYVPRQPNRRQGISVRKRKQLRQDEKKRNILFLGFELGGFPWLTIQTINNIATAAGYTITFGQVVLVKRSIEKAAGVIIGVPVTDPELKKLLRRKPAVKMLGSYGKTDCQIWDHVTYDNWRVGELAGEYLHRKGHTDVAVFYPDNEISQERTAGFRKFCEDRGIAVRLFIFNMFQLSDIPLNCIIHDLFNKNVMPPGIFMYNAENTVRLYNCLAKAGLRPMKDIDIVTCDNDRNYIHSLYPPPAVVNIFPEQIALKSFELLQERITHPWKSPETIVIEPELIECPPE